MSSKRERVGGGGVGGGEVEHNREYIIHLMVKEIKPLLQNFN